MNVRLSDDHDKEKWDAFVRSHNKGLPYHLFAWKETVEQAYKHKTYYFIAEKQGKIIGVLPTVHLNPPFFSGGLVSLPFCDAGSVLSLNPDAKERLIDKVVEFGEKIGVRTIDLRSNEIFSTIKTHSSEWRVETNKVRMILDLPESSDKLWDSFKSKLRSQVRKAEKNGLTFYWGGIDDLREFYKVFSRNMRDLGSPVHSMKWMKHILLHFGEYARIGLVTHKGKPIGVGLILFAGNNVCIPWASTLREFNALSPNMLLYWNFLKYAADNGYSQFDLGRSTPGEGTYKFKVQWGAKESPLFWHSLRFERKGFNESENKVSSLAKRQLLAGIWQQFPLSVANTIGPVVRKYISL